MTESTESDFHGENLQRLCRICGNFTIGYKREVSRCLPLLQLAFKTECFDNEQDCIHPKYVCTKCYTMLLNVQKKSIVLSQHLTKWIPHCTKDCSVCSTIKQKSIGGRPKKKKPSGRPPKVLLFSDIMNLDESRPVPPEVEKALTHVMNIKMKQSPLPNNSVQLKTNSSAPLTVTPITFARKDSTTVTKKTVRYRTKESMKLLKIISGGSADAVTHQTTHIVKSLELQEREKLFPTWVDLQSQFQQLMLPP